MRRLLAILSVVFVAVATAGGLSALWAYRATQQVPQFYQVAVAIEPEVQKQASDECLEQAAALAGDVRKFGHWEAEFTAEQINGWLAVDLKENFPDLLPPEIQDPRVQIGAHEATLACRYQPDQVASVLSLTFDVYPYAPNVIAVRIVRARAGALPLPLNQVLEAITDAFQSLNVQLQWRQADGDPVALITIPPPRDKHDRPLELESLELRDGFIYVAGETLREQPGDKIAVGDFELKPITTAAKATSESRSR